MPNDKAVAIPVPLLHKVCIVETLCPGVMFSGILDIGKLYTFDMYAVLTPGAYGEVATDIPDVVIDVTVLASESIDG